MTVIAKPEAPRIEPIAAHVYSAPVVHEIPATPSAGCWDKTW